MKITLMLALLATSLVAVPGLVSAQTTSTAVPFLLIAPDARASGMGDVGTATADDAGAIYWNPSGLAYQTGKQVGLTHSQWLPQFNQNDLFYDYADFMWNDEEKFGGTIAASIVFLNLGEFFYTTESSPTPITTFHSFEYAVTLAYATKLSPDWSFGGNLKYIQSTLSTLHVANEQSGGVGRSVAFDLSTTWKPDSLYPEGIADAMQIGIALTNIGPKMRYVDQLQADPLPTELRIGGSYKLYKDEYNELTVATDIAKLLVKRDSSGFSDPLPKSFITSWDANSMQSLMWSSGVEYWYDKLMALRAGYYTEGPKVGSRKYMTFGAGLRYDAYQFDFSYINTFEENHPLANTLRFTLGIRW
jgi:hypothetical protein